MHDFPDEVNIQAVEAAADIMHKLIQEWSNIFNCSEQQKILTIFIWLTVNVLMNTEHDELWHTYKMGFSSRKLLE